MRFRSRTFWRAVARRLIGLSVLLSLCAVLLPLPLAPLLHPGTGKDLSKPFPCQKRACGCQSADQCWKKCCCFTNSQKVAWARANKITLPDFVLVAAKTEESRDTKLCKLKLCETKTSELITNHPDAKSGHCELQATSSVPCCTRKAQNALMRRCCEDKLCKHARCTSSEAASNSDQRRSAKWILTMIAAECQGQGMFLLNLPLVVVAEWSTIPAPPQRERADIRRPESERLSTGSLTPPTPPPKIV